jgi:hypothetical protein
MRYAISRVVNFYNAGVATRGRRIGFFLYILGVFSQQHLVTLSASQEKSNLKLIISQWASKLIFSCEKGLRLGSDVII